MADLSDVMNALVSQITNAIYPNGTSAAAANGAPTTVYPGWPIATTLNSDLMAMFNAIKAGNGPTAGRVHISVYTANVEQNITKSLDGWQNVGTVTSGHRETAKEVRRVKRQFMVTVYAATPQLRDLTGSLIDVALCDLRNLPLADGTVGQVYYGNTALDDAPSKEYMYSRKEMYFIEYGTFALQQSPLVTEVVFNGKGGYDPASVLFSETIPPVVTVTPSQFQFQIGINLSGLEDGGTVPGVANTDYAVPTTAEMDYYKSLGITHVRLPALWQRIQPTLFGALDATYLGYITTLVNYGASINMPVLIDPLHNFGGRNDVFTLAAPLAVGDSQISLTLTPVGYAAGAGVSIPNSTSIGTIAAFAAGATTIPLASPSAVALASGSTVSVSGQVGNTITSAAFANVWTKLATAFNGNAGILGYDLMNEPANMPPSLTVTGKTSWPDAAQAAVNAIRLVDTATRIFVEGDGYSGAGAWLVNNATLSIQDPSNKIVYEPHSYFDRDSSGTYQNWATEDATPLQSPPNIGGAHTAQIGVQRATVAITWAQDNGHQMWFGEGGIGTAGDVSLSDSWEACLDNVLAYHRTMNVPFIYWAGGPYTGSYFLGLEPSGFVGTYVDTRQAAVIRKYTGAGWNVGTALFTGPNRGQPSVTSGNFSLEVRGYFTQPKTYGLSSTDSTGTFLYNGQTVTSVTLAAGFNQYATIQYVPGSAGISAIIGVTCPSGIVAPAGIGFSTLTDPLTAETAQATNILLPFLVNTSYIGPLMRVYAATDTAMTNGVDFLPVARTVNATVSATAINTALPGATLKVMLYDQGGLDNNQTLVPVGDNSDGSGGGSTLAPSIADLPTLTFDGSSRPVITYSNSRLVANSPINGDTQQWWMVIAEPATVGSMQWCVGWNFTQQDQIAGDGSGDWTIYDGTTTESLPMGVLADTLRVYGGLYHAGVTNGRQTFRDGVLQGAITSGFSSIPYQYRGDVLFGFFNFYPSYFQGVQNGFIAFNGAIPQQGTQTALLAAVQAFYGTPVPPAQVTGLALGTTTSTGQALTWTVVTNATGYVVEITNSSGTTTKTVTGTSTTVTGLASQTSYGFAVYAVNGYGIGLASTPVTVTTPANAAGPGSKLQFIGVNISGLENNPSPINPSSADASYYVSKGFSVFRLCFDQRQAMPLLGGALNSAYMTRIDNAVSLYTGLGARVTLDCHNYGGFASTFTLASSAASGATSLTFTTTCDSFTTGATFVGQTGISGGVSITTTPGSATITFSTPTTSALAAGTVVNITGQLGTTVTNAAFASFWSAIVARYMTNPKVIWDLQNEPQVYGSGIWAGCCQAAINAIRAAETAASTAHHTIFCSVPGYNAGGASVSFFQGVTDTANNMLFEVHQYNDNNGSGTSADVYSFTTGVDRIKSATILARYAGVKLVLGEFATGADPLNTTTPALECLDNELAYIQANADVWQGVLWWGGGDFASALQPGYYFGLAPYNGQDTPWISHLQAYMLGGAQYGYITLAQTSGLAMVGDTYAAASNSAFGQALISGYGQGSSNPDNGAIAVTIETRATLPSSISLGSGFQCILSNTAAFQVDGSGHLNLYFGDTFAYNSGIAINDGAPHTIRYCATGSNAYFFLDGTLLQTLSGTFMSPASPDPGNPIIVGRHNNDRTGTQWPGSIDYVAMWGSVLSTANYTVSSTPPVGTEPNLLLYCPLDGSGTCYA